MTAPTPPVNQIVERIADRARMATDQVTHVLNSFGVSLQVSPPTPRSLTLRRLTFAGEKVNTAWDGPFDVEFAFAPGVTAFITDANLRGKTTVLELLTWLLRGEPRNLRADVKPWLRRASLEYDVNGIPHATRLTSYDGRMFRADIWTASNAQTLRESLDARSPSMDVRVIADGLDENEFAAQQQALMLDRMRLEPITNWQKYPGSDEGRPQVNGWPAYFGAIFLPDAGSDVLLGDVVMAGLPARLLQLFCNVPLMTAYIRCRTLQSQVSQDDSNRARRVKEDAAARGSQRGDLLAESQRLRQSLNDLSSPGSRTAEKVRIELAAAEHAFTEAFTTERNARLLLSEAKGQRQAEVRRLSTVNETSIAKLLFQGLNPKHCPRCETSLGSERIQLENDKHRCAVCTTEVDIPEVDKRDEHEEHGDVEDAGGDALEALVAAEDAARAEVVDASGLRQQFERLVAALTAELDNVQASADYARRRDLELQLARVDGRLEATPEGAPETLPSDTAVVLNAAVRVLNDITGEAAKTIFAKLNEEIADLGRAFGIDNLDSVNLTRQGGMKVTTAGVDESFSKVSGGERLRLRVAVLIALLRVGHRAGIGTHPGLILLDSPGSEELANDDEATLLRELDSLKTEIPGLQVCVASAEPEAVRSAVAANQIFAADGDKPLW
jgi:hypothetical protein